MLANAALDAEMTTEIETLILKSLSFVRSKAVEFCETYAMELLRTEDNRLLADPAAYAEWKIAQVQLLKDQTNVATFFMHERDDKGLVMRWFGNAVFEKFHLNFWYTQTASPVKTFSDNYRTTPTYMYALSGVTFACALDRVATGRTHSSGRALAFTGIEYCSTYKAYHEGFLEALQHAVIGPVLTSRLAWLNKQGMTMLSSNQISASPSKKAPAVFIPPESEVAAYEAESSSCTLTFGNPSQSETSRFYSDTASTSTYGDFAPEAGPSTGNIMWNRASHLEDGQGIRRPF